MMMTVVEIPAKIIICVCGEYLGSKWQGPIPCEDLVTDTGKSFLYYSNSFKLLYNKYDIDYEYDDDYDDYDYDYDYGPFLFMERPVYYDSSIQSEVAVIFFTGSQWVLTKVNHEGDHFFSSIPYIVNYFQSQNKHCNEEFAYDFWYMIFYQATSVKRLSITLPLDFCMESMAHVDFRKWKTRRCSSWCYRTSWINFTL